jgi:Cep192 domain 4
VRIEFQARAPQRRRFSTTHAAAAVIALLAAAFVSGHRLITPGFVLSATQLSFTGVQAGVETAAQHVDLTNPFDADLRVESLTLHGEAGAFRFPWNSCVGKTIHPRDTCQIGVSFVPPATGTRNAALDVTSVNGDRRTVALTGILTPPLVARIESPKPADLEPPTVELPLAPNPVEPRPNPVVSPPPAVEVAPPKPVIPPPAPPVAPKPAPPLPVAPPRPVIAASLRPNPLEFPSVNVGALSVREVTISNTGNAPFPAGQAEIQGDHWNDFRIVNDPCSTRAITSTCAIRVAFIPSEAGQHRATLVLSGGGAVSSAWLDGTATPPPRPIAELQPARVDLTRKDPEHPIELRNVGDGLLDVNTTFLAGKNPEDFSLDPRNCGEAALGRNQGCTMDVVFRADIARREHHKVSEALVTVQDNAEGSPHSVIVTGAEGSNGQKKILLQLGEAAAGYYIGQAGQGRPDPRETPVPKGNPPVRGTAPPQTPQAPPPSNGTPSTRGTVTPQTPQASPPASPPANGNPPTYGTVTPKRPQIPQVEKPRTSSPPRINLP